MTMTMTIKNTNQRTSVPFCVSDFLVNGALKITDAESIRLNSHEREQIKKYIPHRVCRSCGTRGDNFYVYRSRFVGFCKVCMVTYTPDERKQLATERERQAKLYITGIVMSVMRGENT